MAAGAATEYRRMTTPTTGALSLDCQVPGGQHKVSSREGDSS